MKDCQQLLQKYFVVIFGQIPNIYTVDKIDDKKLRYEVAKGDFGKVIHQISREEYDAEKQSEELNIHNFFLNQKLS